MNHTNFEHAGWALLFQFVIASAFWLFVDLWTIGLWAGGLFAVGFFIGREHAQAQRSKNLGVFRAFDVRLWSWDARLDLLFPFVAVLAAAITNTIF
jgi:hypothetical protein